MSYCYDYPHPAVTVDIIVVNRKNNEEYVLLIERKNDPFKGKWALPGGFVDKDEALIDAAIRELWEETHLEGLELKQFSAYGNPGRDPRGHCVSVVYTIEVEDMKQSPRAGDDAKNTEWFLLDDLPLLAFDHNIILQDYIKSKIKKPFKQLA